MDDEAQQIVAPTMVYRPLGAADRLFATRDPEVLLEGPAGTGKSRALLEKCLAVADKYPMARILLARKTRASMTESVLVTFERDVLPEGAAHWIGPARRGQRRGYRLPNGSEILILGVDDPQKIMSAEFDIVAVFEATELLESDWEMLTSRLRNGKVPYQQAIADCNPASPQHWLNQRAKTDRMVRLCSRHEDNPLLWDKAAGKWTDAGAAYIAKLDNLTGPRRDRLRFGRWAAAEGLIYGMFDAERHRPAWAKMPPDTRYILAVDFGFNDPFVCQWWAYQPGNDLMVRYREIYMTGRLVEDHAKQIKTIVGRDPKPPEAVVCDHDREDRATLEKHTGLRTTPAIKSDILVGIQKVQARLQGGGPDGKPRMVFMRDCLVETDHDLFEAKAPVCTEDEFDCYMWALQKGRAGNKDVPIDKDNHGLDAARYAAEYFDAGRPAAPSVPAAESIGRAFERPSLRGMFSRAADNDWDD